MLSLLFPPLLNQTLVPLSPPQPADYKPLASHPLMAEALVQPWAQEYWLKPRRPFSEGRSRAAVPSGHPAYEFGAKRMLQVPTETQPNGEVVGLKPEPVA